MPTSNGFQSTKGVDYIIKQFESSPLSQKLFKGKSPSKHNVIELLINQPTDQVNCFHFSHVGISLYSVVNWAFTRELTNCWFDHRLE